ncbi:MAG: hypothetical protein KGL53_02410 [Elusimicrobia bacterium]|nr:hypothetical protein [Elusimicrobiota bacterium]
MGLDSQAAAFGAGASHILSGQNILAFAVLTVGALAIACAVGLVCRRKVRLRAAGDE